LSAHALSVVWADFRADSLAKLAMLALADSAGDKGGNVLPPIRVFAAKLSCSDDEAERVLCHLIAQGHVEVFQDWRGRCYALRLPGLATS